MAYRNITEFYVKLELKSKICQEIHMARLNPLEIGLAGNRI